MSAKSKRRLRRMLLMDDKYELNEALWYYNRQNYKKAAKIFTNLRDRLIIEPLKGTEEYDNGERKPEISEGQPEDEKGDSQSPERGELRDAQGYLI